MGLKDKPRLLLVANPEEHHVGAHFLAAAQQLGLEVQLMDVRSSHSKNIWVNRVFHRLGRRPAHLDKFSRQVVARCREFRPDCFLVTGISAPSSQALLEIGKMGIQRANYLTDDPWNPANGACFFWAALREYDAVFSPRRSNIEDLRRHGCRQVEYLPFGYNPKLHFPEHPATAEEIQRFCCDVAFVGGADADRLPLARALVRTGMKVKLYGGYWNRDAELRSHWQGFVYGREFRLAVGGAAVNVCIGRKANRDGHAMRSLELPAMKACLVVEDTLEHRELFDAEGKCVEYFLTTPEMVARCTELCRNPQRAREKGEQVFARITLYARHTYGDRLVHILKVLNERR